jgi:hypothetical protein
MGVVLWLACGTAAFVIATIIPHGRSAAYEAEMNASLITAFVLGLVATALDFGGLSEPDWRAGLFAFFGSLAAAGAARFLMRYFSADTRS